MYLHPEKGVNPRMGVCSRCGEDIGVILLGRNENIHQCTSCGMKHLGGWEGKCKKCGGRGHIIVGKIGDYDKLPMGLCDECKAIDKEMREAIADGGIYWKCTICNSEGAIKKGAPICKAVREELGVEAPNPCGVKFDGAPDCPVCGKKTDTEVEEHDEPEIGSGKEGD